METENKINCNCLDVVYDVRNKTLKNGKYATIDNTEKGDNIFIPVGNFDVKNNKLPEYANKQMEANRNSRPTALAQRVVREDAQQRRQQISSQTQQTTKVGDVDK